MQAHPLANTITNASESSFTLPAARAPLCQNSRMDCICCFMMTISYPAGHEMIKRPKHHEIFMPISFYCFFP
ncbi:MAG: hypothetical protein CSA52_00785 [Gammaproteobacteria bacterium]|nr:MAG: hypothetical protein CSA52_00785 [Gammaproteobacteria bacterium]